MEMRQRDEEKRSKAWVLVMLISTGVIMLVLGFFLTRSMLGNPLEGEWASEEKGYYLDIDDDNELTVEGTFDGVYTEVELRYTIDKKEKVIALKANPDSYHDAAEDSDGSLTPQEIDESLESFIASYNYSIENDTLTLTEREYGEQFIFTRIKK